MSETATAVVIQRPQAVALLAAVGLKTCDKWANDKLEKALLEFRDYAELAADTKFAPEVETTRQEVLKCIEEKGTFSIAGDAPPEATKPRAAPKAPATPADPAAAEAAAKEKADKAAAKAAAAEAKEKEKADKAAAKEKAKAEKEALKAKAAADKEAKKASRQKAQVDLANEKGHTANEVAGLVIYHAGLEAGVTQQMVNTFNAFYGRENDYRTWFDLKAAWHILHAFTGSGLESAPGVKVGVTRPSLAGKMFREKGGSPADFPTNDAAVAAELDKRFGKTNPRESTTTLRIAKAVIQGFQAGPTTPVPQAPVVPVLPPSLEEDAPDAAPTATTEAPTEQPAPVGG